MTDLTMNELRKLVNNLAYHAQRMTNLPNAITQKGMDCARTIEAKRKELVDVLNTLTADLDAARADAAEGRRLLEPFARSSKAMTAPNDYRIFSTKDSVTCGDFHSARTHLATPNPGAELLAELTALRAEHEVCEQSDQLHAEFKDVPGGAPVDRAIPLMERYRAAHALVERLRKGE